MRNAINRSRLAGALALLCVLAAPTAFAANEITVTAALSYTNAAQNIPQTSLAINNLQFNISGSNFAYGTKSFPTTAGGTAIPLGGVGTLGWAIIKNNDATNYVQVLNAVSGTVLLRVNPGEAAVFRFDQGVTAPAILAHTASVVCEYLILEN